MSVQPIAGVSPRNESVVMTEYPSIAAGPAGQVLGSLYNSLPIPIFGLKLSHLLFALPTAPIAVLLYFWHKVFGRRYVLTNRSVQVRSALSGQRLEAVELSKIAEIDIVQAPGQVFYRAADLLLRGASGEVLVRLHGVPDAPSFANAIQRMIESRQMVEAAMDTIRARG